MTEEIKTVTSSVFWNLASGGLSQTDRPAILAIDDRSYKNPTNASLQRLIGISKNGVSVEVEDSTIEVYGSVERKIKTWTSRKEVM